MRGTFHAYCMYVIVHVKRMWFFDDRKCLPFILEFVSTDTNKGPTVKALYSQGMMPSRHSTVSPIRQSGHPTVGAPNSQDAPKSAS
jgi:hypothetical protein